ncbi:MAG: methyltransferase [Kofleriaceae bacterium]
MYDLSHVIDYYDRLLETEADASRAMGWQISHSREVAVLSLTRVEGLADGARVLDIGCGLGTLYDYFEKAGPRVEYTGYDISAKAIERARERHPNARFEVRDILRDPPRERFDFVLCSGALSYRLPDQGSYVVDMVQAMYQLADVALAFNMLSAWAYMESPTLQREAVHADYEWPDEVFRFCKTLSRHVTLSNDTRHGGFDVFVYRRNIAALKRYLAWTRPGATFGPEVEAAIEYHLELGLYAELRDFLRTLSPSVEVLNYLGHAHAELGERAAAVEAFRKAIAMDPAYPWPYVNLGKLATRDRDAEGAITHLRAGMIASPRNLTLREELVKALLAAGRRAEARVALAELPEGALRHYLLGLAADDPTAALAAFERAIQAAPSYLDAIAQAAFVRERIGDKEGALSLWGAAARIAPMDQSIAERIKRLRAG